MHIPAIMSVAFPNVVVFDGFISLWNCLFTRKQNARVELVRAVCARLGGKSVLCASVRCAPGSVEKMWLLLWKHRLNSQ